MAKQWVFPVTWAQDSAGLAGQFTLHRCDIRPAFNKPFAERTVDHGFGDPIVYRFNSQGYRGEEFDPDAAFRICVIGESHAAGHGVEIEQAFGHRLKLHIAQALDLKPAQVNSLNFASSGTSADYCVRTIYRQLTRFPVDLVVCNMPVPDRVEYFHEDEPKTLNLRLLDPARLEDAPEPLLAFADYYTPQMGDIGLLKNLLLVQQFCRGRGIGCVQAIQHRLRIGPRTPHLLDFAGALDAAGFLDSRLFSMRPDKAADGKHAGQRTHAGYAISVLETYANALADQGETVRAPKLLEYVKQVKQSDPDWAFCQDAVASKGGGANLRMIAPGQRRRHVAQGIRPSDVCAAMHPPNSTVSTYATDATGDVTYRFDNKGYRGPDQNPSARFRICVIGDGDVFGVGLDVKHTFGEVLKSEIAAALGLACDQVDVLNLSVAGQSPDYCVRTIYRQLPHTSVDLVVCCMPPLNRAEYCSDDLTFQTLDLAAADAETMNEMSDSLAAFNDLYTNDMGQVALIKNMLMVQQICARHACDLVLTSADLPERERLTDRLTGFNTALEQSQILDSQLFRACPDTSADNVHAGPRTHRAFAIAVLHQFALLCRRKDDTDRATRLLAHVQNLMTSDPDWRFCQNQPAVRRPDDVVTTLPVST